MHDLSNLHEIGKVLISKQDIEKRVLELAKEISEHYKNDSAELVFVGILKGSISFLSDLMRNMEIPVSIDFMAISSYGFSTSSTGDVRVLKDLDRNIEGKNIVIVEDIIDTGYTLDYLIKNLSSKGAKSIKIAALLSKPDRRKIDIEADYTGFEIPDEFVVGYGIDYAEKYRHLPFIGIVKREVYEK